MQDPRLRVAMLLVLMLVAPATAAPAPVSQLPRVLVSTDIGGSDPDDFQSMVHLLVYALDL